MLNFPLPDDAVLSQSAIQNLKDLRPPHWAPFDQADQHLQVRHHQGGTRLGYLGHRLCRGASTSFLVLDTLFDPSAFVAVIRRATLVGLTPPVRFPASKRTAKIVPACVSRVCKENNPAMPAPCQALLEIGSAFNLRPQKPVIRYHQSAYLFPQVPVRTKFKMLRDRCCKKATLSLIMLILVFDSIAPFYLVDASVSTGLKWGLFSQPSPAHTLPAHRTNPTETM